jgi:hypothetical protein
MVFFFKSRCGEYTIYMGRDKYENEGLIKYGLPEDVWFHVDSLSSAHVYLRLKDGETMDDITPDLLLDCSSLVKANSIAGCKVSAIAIATPIHFSSVEWRRRRRRRHRDTFQYGTTVLDELDSAGCPCTHHRSRHQTLCNINP